MSLIRGFGGLAARVFACAIFAVLATESAVHAQGTPAAGGQTGSTSEVVSAPSGSPPPSPGARARQAAPAAKAPERRVDIDAYDVDGNSILDQEAIESAVYPFLGPERSRDDVEGARKALEQAYQSRGYQSVVVEIPPQTVTNGIVKLHVVEAPIGRLRVVGSHYYLPSAIKSQVPALAPGTVPNIQVAQEQLNDVNRLPDRRVTPVLKPGQVPGTIDVDLHVTDTLPLHASAEVNNDHSPNTDPLRVIGTVHYDDLWQEGHSLSLTWLRAPQNVHSGQVFSASYLAPVWESPWNILVYGYQSNSDVNTLGGTNVLGDGYTVGARGVLQLPSFGDFTQTFSFGPDFKHFLEGITFGTSGTNATVDYVPITAAYNLGWATPDATVLSQSSVELGTRGIGSTPAEFENNRAFASANFIHLNEDITYTQHLPFDTLGVFHFAGQLADQPLLSSEQFAAGGLTSVRGYLQSEAIGDDGLLESNELRSPSLTQFLSPYLDMSAIDDWRIYGFADLAHVWILGALPGQTNAFTLESIGAGMRVGALGHLTGVIDVGLPLRSGPATAARKPRLTFSVKSEM
ncbi:MAG TPA: POTRA domain-containing protein [Rhizomicrobium sp.]|jgi:hemolysin activation/secretion protein|nr:POTRA domain-containing protein [Rhizomicrobium sp.]